MKTMRLAALAMLALAGLANAQVHKCTDSNGKTLYTEKACPNQGAQVKTFKAPPPSNGAAPAPEKDWAAVNEAIHQRQAQRERNQMIENNNRAAIDAFNKAVNKPLAPGETRRTTLTLPSPQ